MSINYLIFFIFVAIGFATLGISRKFKLAEPLILIFLGLIMQYFLNLDLLILIKFCLIILAFDVGAHFIPNKFNIHSLKIGEFIIFSWLIYSFVFFIIISQIWYYKLWYLNLIFALFVSSLIVATSQFELLRSFKVKHNRLYNLTVTEDNLSSSFMMITGLILFVFMQNFDKLLLSSITLTSLGLIFVDLSVGVFSGLIMLFFIVRVLKRKATHYATAFFAFFTYFLSLFIGGTGFISVFVSSIFYHNVTSKEPEMCEFKPFLSNLVYVCVFLMLGFFVYIDNNVLVLSAMLFMLYLFFRYVVLKVMFKYSQSFLAFDCPKGLASGALLLLGYKGLYWCCGIRESQLFSIIILFFVWCILFSYFINIYTHKITN